MSSEEAFISNSECLAARNPDAKMLTLEDQGFRTAYPGDCIFSLRKNPA